MDSSDTLLSLSPQARKGLPGGTPRAPCGCQARHLHQSITERLPGRAPGTSRGQGGRPGAPWKAWMSPPWQPPAATGHPRRRTARAARRPIRAMSPRPRTAASQAASHIVLARPTRRRAARCRVSTTTRSERSSAASAPGCSQKRATSAPPRYGERGQERVATPAP